VVRSRSSGLAAVDGPARGDTIAATAQERPRPESTGLAATAMPSVSGAAAEETQGAD
jgi:hypothetical protein